MNSCKEFLVFCGLSCVIAACGATSTPSDGDADTESDGDVEPDSDIIVEPDSDIIVEPDADLDDADRPDADPDSDPGSDADLRPDADTPPDECPGEMVLVAELGVCIDRYEASRGDADRPRSVAGEMPWSQISWEEATLACSNAGKRLCTADEWIAACQGPDDLAFPYGNIYAPGRCHDLGSYPALQETGIYPECEGGVTGLFDMSGNVAEWVSTPAFEPEPDASSSFYFPHGGSWVSDNEELECRPRGSSGFAPHVRDRSIGFRCCLSLEP